MLHKCAELEDLAACDVVVITAGAKSRPGESRLDLLSRNAETLTAVIDGLFPGRHSGAPPPNPRTVLLVVSNPVDVLTRIAQLLTDGILPRNQVKFAVASYALHFFRRRQLEL